ncbi:TonB-dependent siderophore receptor [Pseudorhodoferax sp. Leaf274]|uniref:TonB-dependent siderophore receptor n=1 Tax=Pseudorhodoferax sp. Leaf274 TaxID=1736318 RepID=UPI000702C5F1|nr:TonB-dependent siderophore receptor [Pseudorhodoferax sp. Leaf274]KQP38950.1 hypothetical protein ASF44_10980 [Pseudorhodoferax sp. Leaf274]
MPPLSRPRARPALRTAASAALLAALHAGAFAQDASAGPPPARAAQAWDIPAGPLDSTLALIARRSGRGVVADPALLRGKAAPALRGSFDAQEAALRALAGSGLVLAVTASGSFTVRPGAPAEAAPAAPPAPAPAASATPTSGAALPEVRVKAFADRESATGPAAGFVARRTATATKTDTPLAETPQSVSIVTRAQMDAQNAQSVSDALRYTAGVMTEANGPDPRADVIGVRGFSAGSRSAFRDGLRDFAFNGQGGIVIESYGLERVEVLRGPSSVLYGQGDAGGTVNLVSKRPTREDLREVQLQLGSHQRRQAATDLGGSFGPDSPWSWRLTALARDSATQIDHVEDDRLFVAPALTWQPNADTRLTLLADHQRNARGQGYQAWPRVGTLAPAAFGTISERRFVGEPGFDRFDQRRSSAGYQFEHRLDESVTLRQNLRATAQETRANSIYEAGYDDGGPLVRRFGSAGRERIHSFTLDNQLQWRFTQGALSHTVLAGLDHQRFRGSDGAAYAAMPSLDLMNPVYGQPLPIGPDAPADDRSQRLTQTGLYLQDQVKLGERWAFTLGGRWDRSQTSTTTLADGTTAAQRDHAFTWRAGAVYLADGGWAPYVGLARSFSPTVGTDAQNRAFRPETARQAEAGVRWQPAGQGMALQAAVFDLRRQNVLTGDPQNPDFSVQRGEVRSRGLELEAKATLARGLDLVAAYTFNDVEVTRSTGTDLGHTPSATPRQMASLWLGWQMLPGMKLSAGVRHVGRTWGDEEETVAVPGYTLLDAALLFELGQWAAGYDRWTLALNASNLTDRRYVATCGYFADGCKWGYRRALAATLTYRW